jgi:hypothetical protein
MDGLIFLRGAFFDPSIKVIFIHAVEGNTVNTRKVTSMTEVDTYLKEHKSSGIRASEIKYQDGVVQMKCVLD